MLLAHSDESYPFLDDRLTANNEVVVEAGDMIEHDLALRFPSGVISGTVTYPEGDPIRDQHVVADSLGSGGRLFGKTDAEGRFEIEVFDIGSNYRISASRGGDWKCVENVSVGTKDVRLILPHSAFLRYRVVDVETRKPVSAYGIAWRGAGGSAFSSIEEDFERPDPDGWFTTELPVGRIDLIVRADQLGYRAAFVRDVWIGGPEEARVEIELEKGISVVLRLDESCGPIPADHMVLLLESEAWDQVRHWTTPDGGNY